MDKSSQSQGVANVTRRSIVGGLAAGAAIAIGGVALPRAAFAASALKAFAPKGQAGFNHSAFDALLEGNVRLDAAGYASVDYAALMKRRDEVSAYVGALSSADPTALSRAEAHAYWINFYNALTLDVVLSRYPVGSIREIALGGGGLFGRGPWSKKLFTVNGAELSLDDIELQ
jgi:hypothetical protein